MNEASVDELVAHELISEGVAREIIIKREASPFVTWADVEQTVDTITPSDAIKLQKAGVRLTSRAFDFFLSRGTYCERGRGTMSQSFFNTDGDVLDILSAESVLKQTISCRRNLQRRKK